MTSGQELSPVDGALLIASRGCRVARFPLGSKISATKGWKAQATNDPNRIRTLFGGARCNVAVLTDGKLIVDVDIYKGHAEWPLLKELPPTFTIRSARGGLHYYFNRPEGVHVSGSASNLAPGVDIRADGSHVMGPGSTFEGQPYTVIDHAPIAMAPVWLIDLLQASRQSKADKGPVGELDTTAAIESARSYLLTAREAIEGCGGNETTYKVSCSVKDRGVSKETCVDLMLEHYNPRCRPEWNVDELQSIVNNAYEYGQAVPGRDNPAAGFCVIEMPKQEIAASLSYWVRDEQIDAEIDWLVDEAIQRGGIGFLGGKSGSGKTFHLVHMALSGAKGRSYFGRKIGERFGTYIVAAEGSYSITHRVKAAAVHAFGIETRDALNLPIAFTKGAVDVMSAAGLASFIADLKQVDANMRRDFGVPLGLVAFDTFGQAFTLRDEDASTEVTRATKIMHAVSQSIGTTCVATHHFGHGAERLRGSSALRANADFVIELRKNGEVFLEKCRDAAEVRLGWGDLPIVQVGAKADGRPITSCHIRERSGPKGKSDDPAAGFALVQSGHDFEEAFVNSGADGADLPAVEAAFIGGRLGKLDSRKKAFKRALTKALATAFVLERGRLYKQAPDRTDMSRF